MMDAQISSEIELIWELVNVYNAVVEMWRHPMVVRVI